MNGYSIASGGSQSLDLSGSLEDCFGDSMVFSKVYGILVINKTATTGKVVRLGADANRDTLRPERVRSVVENERLAHIGDNRKVVGVCERHHGMTTGVEHRGILLATTERRSMEMNHASPPLRARAMADDHTTSSEGSGRSCVAP